jgi:hypothetical protein
MMHCLNLAMSAPVKAPVQAPVEVYTSYNWIHALVKPLAAIRGWIPRQMRLAVHVKLSAGAKIVSQKVHYEKI